MAVSKFFQGFSSCQVNEAMYVSVLVGYDSPPEDCNPSLYQEMENLSYEIYTLSIQALFISDWLVVPVT